MDSTTSKKEVTEKTYILQDVASTNIGASAVEAGTQDNKVSKSKNCMTSFMNGPLWLSM